MPDSLVRSCAESYNNDNYCNVTTEEYWLKKYNNTLAVCSLYQRLLNGVLCYDSTENERDSSGTQELVLVFNLKLNCFFIV